jgi:hypothetical protein
MVQVISKFARSLIKTIFKYLNIFYLFCDQIEYGIVTTYQRVTKIYIKMHVLFNHLGEYAKNHLKQKMSLLIHACNTHPRLYLVHIYYYTIKPRKNIHISYMLQLHDKILTLHIYLCNKIGITLTECCF